MICGRREDALRYRGLCPALDRALEYIFREDFSGQVTGRHTLDTWLRYNLVETRTKYPEDTFWEAHRKNIDIHYVLEGSERIQVSHILQMSETEPYQPGTDAAKYAGRAGVELRLEPGWFAICFPEDVHRALVCTGGPEDLRKVIFKASLEA